MVRKIKMELPKVTQAGPRDRRSHPERRSREKPREAKMNHYGKFVLGQSQNRRVRACDSNTQGLQGVQFFRTALPGHRGLAGASAAELREFYAKVLAAPRWTVRGRLLGDGPTPFRRARSTGCALNRLKARSF